MKDYEHYYELFTDTPFVGTDEIIFIASNGEYEIDEDVIREDLYASYGYMINGWGEDDPTDEEYENFIADCTVELTAITKEAFLEGVDEGFSYEIYD